MLYIYGTLLSLILLMEIGVAVAGLVLKDEADAAVTAAMNKNLKEYATDKPTQDAWAQIQSHLKCCGITEAEGCGKDILKAEDNSQTLERIHTQGCLTTVRGLISSNVVVVAGTAAGVVVLQLIGIVVVCCLANRMREQKQYV